MKIIDTYPAALAAYDGAGFSFERWKKYIDSALPGLYAALVEDAKAICGDGNFSSADFLSVLNSVIQNPRQLETAHDSFLYVTNNLENTIFEHFGKDLDVTVAFYLGLCNGAGWVTEYRGQTAVLLGMEKILELDWCRISDMYGLICHELGHVYQGQYGVLKREFERSEDAFLWQLFTEGVAMCFEQIIVGAPGFFHQDKGGWKAWCDRHFGQIKADFASDLRTMTAADQRYFGDWVSYYGHGDVGYYLGSKFVQYILQSHKFDDMISFDIAKVRELFEQFI